MAAKRKCKKDDLLPAALEMYHQGAPITRIAAHLNVNRRTVRPHVDEYHPGQCKVHPITGYRLQDTGIRAHFRATVVTYCCH
jgi:hypothetical protein